MTNRSTFAALGGFELGSSLEINLVEGSLVQVYVRAPFSFQHGLTFHGHVWLNRFNFTNIGVVRHQ